MRLYKITLKEICCTHKILYVPAENPQYASTILKDFLNKNYNAKFLYTDIEKIELLADSSIYASRKTSFFLF